MACIFSTGNTILSTKNLVFLSTLASLADQYPDGDKPPGFDETVESFRSFMHYVRSTYGDLKPVIDEDAGEYKYAFLLPHSMEYVTNRGVTRSVMEYCYRTSRGERYTIHRPSGGSNLRCQPRL